MTLSTSDIEANTERTGNTSNHRYGVVAFYTLFLVGWSLYAFDTQSHLVTKVDRFFNRNSGDTTPGAGWDDVDVEGNPTILDDDNDLDLDPMNAPNLYDDSIDSSSGGFGVATRDKKLKSPTSSSWVTAEHLKLSSVSSRKYSTEPETEFCTRVSTHGFNKAPLRIFIYQKGGGEQLVNILIHYLQALTYDEIVIITNEERDSDDILSDYLYRDIVAKGIHFWQCSGNLVRKGNRWTEVIQQYQNFTDFVLPIDADEYLSISSPETAEMPQLIWNRPALLDALKALPPSGGKPYKTLDAKPIPVDCKNHPDADPVVPLFDKRHYSKYCAVPGISQGKLNCFTKNIFEGKEFVSVDNGNHHGPKEREKEFRTTCENDGVEAVYIPTNFVLAHYQVLQYSDWFLHLIKRVVDYKYMDCSNPQPSWPYYHVCNLYAKGQETNFSVHELTPLYEDLFCENLRVYYDISTMTSLSC